MLASDIDPILGKDLVLPLLQAIEELWAIPCNISQGLDRETKSFECMQLSAQGAERQRKNVLC